ncbi:MAG: alpha/beta hydrolase [Deltaproteobacteria bacterium]|nr:alpha/beta hydrolase [Deltaproteobacteria bacterium]
MVSVANESFSVKDRVETRLARSLMRMPSAAIRALAGRPIERDGRTLDPQAQLAILAAQRVGKKPAYQAGVAADRRDMDISGRQLGPEPARLAWIENRMLAGLPVRIYRPHGITKPAPALMYLHGGGFTSGSLESHDLVCQATAASTPCTVIAVDYRLAPEHRFPAAADDATKAFRTMVADAEVLAIDAKRIAVGGDSAGGNLSAVVALDTRNDAVRPCFQLLVYPAVDMTMSFPSMDIFDHGFFLEKESIRWYRNNYLGPDATDGLKRDPRASPWFASDLSGLPSALVITAGFDPLRDEGDAYAKRLAEAGVEVEHKSYASLFHGFWNTTGIIRAAGTAFDDAIRSLRAAFARRA